MRVLVCGGRGYTDRSMFVETMDKLDWIYNFSTVIHGAARGADTEAEVWGVCRNKTVLRYPADWNKDGGAAGPIRNQRMLDEGRPDVVVAFPGGRGTADMVRRSVSASINTIEVSAAPTPVGAA